MIGESSATMGCKGDREGPEDGSIVGLLLVNEDEFRPGERREAVAGANSNRVDRLAL